MPTIELIYTRLPDRVSHFQQELLYEDEGIIVTTQRLKPSNPIVIDGATLLGDGFRAVWFVFANRWYDVGKIYNLDEQFTGYYCDIVMPMKRIATHFELTDLFLDLWILPDGRYQIHDEDEFEAAIRDKWIRPELAAQAKRALRDLIAEVESDAFPPEIVNHW